MLRTIIRLNLSRVEKRVRDNHKVAFTYDDSVPELIATRCTELERGARMVDAMITNTMLPDISRELLERMMECKPVTKVHVTAKDAQFYEKRNEIIVREPEITFYIEGGNRKTLISGREGHLTVDGRELRSVTLIGNVSVLLDDLTLETEEATYDHARDLITASGPVTVRGRQLDLRGLGMEVKVGPQHVRFLRDVHTIVHSDAAAS